jgi:uncharacterized membrane protein
MAFCPNCGAQVTGAFCPNCGTAMAGAGAGPGATPPPGAPPPAGSYVPPPAGVQAGGLSTNAAGALCYTPFFIGLICSIVFLVIAPYNRDRAVRFHAFQSLFLHAALFIFWFVLHIVVGTFAVVTHGFGFVAFGLYPLIWLCILILFIVLMYKTYNNQTVKLPVIGDLAAKQS